MKIIALLPMKGNSERVPNKNLKQFNGVPLYHVVMNTLLKSKYIDEVIVNTDSERIKSDIHSNFKEKVVVIDRPKEIIGDYVSMNKIIEHDLSMHPADLYLQTHSTNPLLKTKSIDAAIEKMMKFQEEQTYDSVFSVTRWQTRLYDKNGNPHNHDPKELIRTQDLDPLYEENSNFYIFTTESFSNVGQKRIGENPYMFELNKIESSDIDVKEDFLISELLHKLGM